MESFYLFSSGELKRKDNVIRLNRADGAYKDIKIEVARDIFLFGEVQTNTKCLNYLSEKKFQFIFLIIMVFILELFILEKRMFLELC